MEIEAVLEANKNLNKKIEKLEKENSDLWHFKEKFFDLERYTRELEKRFEIKRNVVRVVKKLGHINFVLQIIKVDDTSEGMYIEVNEPNDAK